MNFPAELTKTMKRVGVLAAMFAATRGSGAQSLTVSGSPGTLRVQAAIAGSAPTPVSNSATTYTITVGNNASSKITARLNADMPAGVTLTLDLAAPSGATDNGAVPMSSVSQDVVTSIPKHTSATKSITYTLTATAAAGVVPSASRTVTLTVIAGA